MVVVICSITFDAVITAVMLKQKSGSEHEKLQNNKTGVKRDSNDNRCVNENGIFNIVSRI